MLISACGKYSKLSAEEAGYSDEFWNSLVDLKEQSFQLVKGLAEYRMYQKLEEMAKANAALEDSRTALARIKENADAVFATLQNTLPPALMSEIHTLAVPIFREAGLLVEPFDLELDAFNFYRKMKLLEKEIDQKPDSLVSDDEISLTYCPPRLIVCLGVSKPPEFILLATIPTPLGEFSIARSESKGVTKLVIESDGKQRFFRLDRPFTVYLPKNCVNVKYEGGELLTISVLSC